MTTTSLGFLEPDPIIYAVPQELYPELAYAMAMAERVGEHELEAFLEPYGLSVAQYAYVSQQPAYKRALAEARAFVQTNGQNKGFQVRARFYAERLVDEIYQMAKDKNTDPALRLKLFESLTRLANLEPTNEKAKDTGASTGGVVINIGQGVRGVVFPNTSTDDTVIEVTHD